MHRNFWKQICICIVVRQVGQLDNVQGCWEILRLSFMCACSSFAAERKNARASIRVFNISLDDRLLLWADRDHSNRAASREGTQAFCFDWRVMAGLDFFLISADCGNLLERLNSLVFYFRWKSNEFEIAKNLTSYWIPHFLDSFSKRHDALFEWLLSQC